jgi:hypothetical protein
MIFGALSSNVGCGSLALLVCLMRIQNQSRERVEKGKVRQHLLNCIQSFCNDTG